MNTRPSLTIIRQIKAPPARVFAALTQPDLMIKWWSPDTGPTVSVMADVRPGGRFSIVFRMANGQEHNPQGVYQEILPDQKLVFTWEWPGSAEKESLVTFRLAAKDGGTELILTHEQLPDAEAQISHERGWNGLLNRLDIFMGKSL
ncbi:SRPBCC family protein [Neogemmobacter tilapiae]|uniref:Activator of HSP90 ATPase n=1 Tax=Neogemmobacter tilapiae TaxID=875041 RepID=A0A918TN70_9RHOB|nr:SRPBCC domain-containing protein [Gemmobacter tilapiae]GHC55245.1 activator of HSP90 ATPase [Gemmobacter tilapiae]